MADNPPNQVGLPKYEFVDGHFYCDGVKVQPYQMTPDEIKRYIPIDFQGAYYDALNRMNPGAKPIFPDKPKPVEIK